MTSESSARTAHPAGKGGFPREFWVQGVNDVQARVTPHLDFDRSALWLSIKADDQSIPFCASSIEELIGVMEDQIEHVPGYRQHNFVFRKTMLSVFPLLRGDEQTRCVGMMLGSTSLYLDEAGVTHFCAELRRVSQTFETYAATRGLRPLSRQLRLASTRI